MAIIEGAHAPVGRVDSVTTTGTVGAAAVEKCTGTITRTLPAASASEGKVFTFKKMDAGTTLTIAADGSDTIDGAASIDLTSQYETNTIICDGTYWHIVK